MTTVENKVSIVVRLVLFLVFTIGVVACIYMISEGRMTDRESALLGILVTILAVLASWIITDMYGTSQYKAAISEVRAEHRNNLRMYALIRGLHCCAEIPDSSMLHPGCACLIVHFPLITQSPTSELGSGRNKGILPHILQARDHDNAEYPYEQARIAVRDCDTGARKFWKARAEDINNNLPVSYQCALAGRHRASQIQDSVEVYVWLIRRSRNRSTFDAKAHFANV